MSSVVCFGELLVDMVGNSGVSLAQTPQFLKAPGGAPANVAVGLSRQGVKARFVGQVGSDPFGDWLQSVLEKENVECKYLKRSETARTTIAFVATREDGRKDICFYRNPGADALLSPADFSADCLDDATIFHCGSVSLSLSPCRETQMLAIETARRRGLLISYDPNWRPSLWNDLAQAREVVRLVLPLSDIVKIADEELEFITGTAEVERAAAQVREAGPQVVIVTAGERGAYFDAGQERGWRAAQKAKVVDTLGAGDAFVAGMLSQVLAGNVARETVATALDWPRILDFANACGAFATQTAGAIPALPTQVQTQAFLADE